MGKIWSLSRRKKLEISPLLSFEFALETNPTCDTMKECMKKAGLSPQLTTSKSWARKLYTLVLGLSSCGKIYSSPQCIYTPYPCSVRVYTRLEAYVAVKRSVAINMFAVRYRRDAVCVSVDEEEKKTHKRVGTAFLRERLCNSSGRERENAHEGSGNEPLACRPEISRSGGPPERSDGGEGNRAVGALPAHERRTI